ncbi:hypothetical protein D3C76_1554680 [compost metagenome]
MSAISSSSEARIRKGLTCAVESRSHIAGISPVITKVLPFGIRFKVVFQVLAIHFSNISANFGRSLSCVFTLDASLCIDSGISLVAFSYNTPFFFLTLKRFH